MSIIGPTYAGISINTILGPGRSGLIGDVLWWGWLDAERNLIAMTGRSTVHDQWDQTDAGVANVDELDLGLAPADPETVAYVALLDAAVDGEIVLMAPTTFVDLDGDTVTLTEGVGVFADAGTIAFNDGAAP